MTRQKRELLHELFQSEGWKYLVTLMQADVENLDTVLGIEDAEKLFFVQGRLFQLQNLLVFPDIVARSLEEEGADEHDL